MKYSLFFALATLAISALAAPHKRTGKNFDRVVTILMENQNFEAIAADPYFSSIAEKHNGMSAAYFIEG